jgi:hypothetical protein
MKKKLVRQHLWAVLQYVFMIHVNLIAIFKWAYAPKPSWLTNQIASSSLSFRSFLGFCLPLWFQPCCQADAGTSWCGALSLQPGNINEQVSPILKETGRRRRWWMGLFVNASEFKNSKKRYNKWYYIEYKGHMNVFVTRVYECIFLFVCIM